MPMYDYKCSCGQKTEVFKPVSQHAAPVICSCGHTMSKIITAPAYLDVPFDSVEYDMPGGPFVYHTRGQLKAEAKKRGLEVDLGKRSRERHIDKSAFRARQR